jgi:hypothetical protein
MPARGDYQNSRERKFYINQGRLMTLETDRQLANTERKLALLDEQIAKAKARPATGENAESIESLVRMANQLREEIIRYRGRRKRQAS